MTSSFSRALTVWRGAILGGIIGAIMTVADEVYSTFQAWDRNYYVVNNREGEEGLITFQHSHWRPPGHLVGVFYVVTSDRSPHTDWDPQLERNFQGCPQDQMTLAAELAIPYWKRQLCLEITAAFWDEGEYLTAATPWETLMEHGGQIISTELIEDLDEALAEWENGCEMKPTQLALARSIFLRKIAGPEHVLELPLNEVQQLAETATSLGSMAVSRDLFNSLGISLVPFT